MKPYPPLGILYLSAWLEKNGIDNEVFDTTFSTKEKFRQYILINKPQVIGIYTNLMTKLNVIDMMGFIRKNIQDCTIIIGGPDVRYNVKDYLKAGATVAVIGEGEETMLDIVKSVQAGNKTEFAHIDGLAYFSGDHFIQTKERTKIKSVDDLPLPNRKKININDYLKAWKDNHGKSAMTVSTQRGCPYTCKWCSTAVYGQSYRRRSAKLVAAELKELKEIYNPDTIWFVDDVFTVSHKWLEAFKNEVKLQDAIIPFECITRADRLNETVLDWLKEAGCFRVWIGAESGSQKVIDLMDRRVDVNYVKQMIQSTRQKGMEAGTFIMLGYPGETEEDIKETVQYLKDANPHHFTITVAYPIKGTSLFQDIEDIQTNELDWENSTDRDRDFKRNYSRKYYEYAVKWVDNEVRGYQKLKNGSFLNINGMKHKAKAIFLRYLMKKSKHL